MLETPRFENKRISIKKQYRLKTPESIINLKPLKKEASKKQSLLTIQQIAQTSKKFVLKQRELGIVFPIGFKNLKQ